MSFYTKKEEHLVSQTHQLIVCCSIELTDNTLCDKASYYFLSPVCLPFLRIRHIADNKETDMQRHHSATIEILTNNKYEREKNMLSKIEYIRLNTIGTRTCTDANGAGDQTTQICCNQFG